MTLVLVSLPQPGDVLAFLGWAATPVNTSQATAHLRLVSQTAQSYTRGKGFSADGLSCSSAIAQVIISATARSLPNPGQAYKLVAGSMEATPNRFEGFTLAEQYVLNGYRVRVL